MSAIFCLLFLLPIFSYLFHFFFYCFIFFNLFFFVGVFDFQSVLVNTHDAVFELKTNWSFDLDWELGKEEMVIDEVLLIPFESETFLCLDD